MRGNTLKIIKKRKSDITSKIKGKDRMVSKIAAELIIIRATGLFLYLGGMTSMFAD